MTTTLSDASFDYDSVDKDTASKLRYFEGALLAAHKDHIKAIWTVGKLLVDVREELANHGNGTFCKWVEATQPIDVRTAQNYMLAWTAFKDCETVSRFAPSAMYLLGNNAEAKRAAIKIAKSGQRVTKKMAKSLVAKFTAESGAGTEPVDGDTDVNSPQLAPSGSDTPPLADGFTNSVLVACPHCEADLTGHTTFSERIVFGEYRCPECSQAFDIGPDGQNHIAIRQLPTAPTATDDSVEAAESPPPAAAAIICPLCESDETVWIPKTGEGQFIPSTYTCGECEEPFVVDEAGKVTRVGAAGANSDDEPGREPVEEPGQPATTVPYTSEDDGENFQTTMPPLDLQAGPVDPPDLGDFETMKMGWRLHVQPIWLVADDANQRAMVAFVKDLL